jgi:hypothetical protein
MSLVLPASAIIVKADPPRLQQMLLNLLNNAMKYTGNGGHIDVSATVEADMALVRIDDDGVGISSQILPQIFELFTREGRQPEIDGQGVGLAVVKHLATAHGGFVEARSPGTNKGASFNLRIPISDWWDRGSSTSELPPLAATSTQRPEHHARKGDGLGRVTRSQGAARSWLSQIRDGAKATACCPKRRARLVVEPSGLEGEPP